MAWAGLARELFTALGVVVFRKPAVTGQLSIFRTYFLHFSLDIFEPLGDNKLKEAEYLGRKVVQRTKTELNNKY